MAEEIIEEAGVEDDSILILGLLSLKLLFKMTDLEVMQEAVVDITTHTMAPAILIHNHPGIIVVAGLVVILHIFRHHAPRTTKIQ